MSKRDFFEAVKSGGVSLRARGVSSGQSVGLNNFFQQGALTSSQLSNFYGGDDAFLGAYESFEEEFYRTVRDKTNLRRGAKVDEARMRAQGTIDLNVLNYEARTRLQDTFKNRVLRVGSLIEQEGLPAAQLPSSNLYRSVFRFRTMSDPTQPMSPTVALLNSLNFSINSSRNGVDAIGIPKTLMSSRRLREISQRTDYTQIFGDLTNKKVITFDTETTGVYNKSQVRSMAMAESIYENGVLKSVQNLSDFNFAYDAPHLGGLTVDTLNGGAEAMGGFLARIEGAQSIATNPQEFLDSTDKFLRRLLEADVVAGHNIGFDVTMLGNSMDQISGFEDHAAYKTMAEFYERVNQGNFLVDTADVARNYLINQVEESLVGVNDLDRASREFISGLYSPQNLAKVATGGSATYADIGNIAMNTNLFELIEAKNPGLVQALSKGSHIAETDVILQSYVAEFIQTKELKISSLDPSFKATKSGDMLRQTIAKSSAITPTTNIADVRHMSAATLGYVKNEGLQGVKAFVDASDAKALGLDPADVVKGGHLRYMDGGYKYVRSVGGQSDNIFDTIDINSSRAQSYLKNLIDDAERAARGGASSQSADKIIDYGITWKSSSAASEMRVLSGQRVSSISQVADQDVINAMGSIYENFGSSQGTNQYAFLKGQGNITPFEAGLAGYNQATAATVGELFAKAGDPMAFLGAESRVFSTVFASATAKIGMREGAKAQAAMTQHADLMAEGGLSYFEVSRRGSIFKSTSVLSASLNAAENAALAGVQRVQLPTQIIREAVGTGNLGGLTISFMDSEEDTLMKLVYNPLKDASQVDTKTISTQIFDLMSDANEVARKMGVQVADLDSSVRATINSLSNAQAAIGRDKTIDVIDELIRSNGITYAESRVDSSIISQLEALGFETQNDVNLQSMVGRSVEVSDDLDSRVVTVAGFADETALKITGNQQRFADAASEKVAYAENVARVVSENKSTVRRRVGKGLVGLGENKLLDMYNKVRPKMGVIGLGLAAASAGYYIAQRNREMSLYNETLEAQPVEKGRNVYTQNRSAAQFVDTSSKRYDPLNSAGTVGNLDRSKIGHTQMGNRKYDHLFSGV